MSISGEELFGKDSNNNLSRQSLKKAKKKKKNLDKLIEDNLPFLVEFYFGSYNKGDQRQKYESHLLRLLGSDVYFIQPLKRLIKKAKKKDKDILPKGLSVMLMDNLDEVRMLYRKQIQQMKGGGSLSDDIANRISTIKALSEVLIANTTEICKALTHKQAKKLVKMGFSVDAAEELACAYVPKDILNPKNVRRYVYRINLTMYNIQKKGVTLATEGDDEDNSSENNRKRYRNGVGVNLGNSDTIKEVYEYLLKGIDRKTYISALVGIMLERRGQTFDSFTEPQLWCYRAITTLVLNVLEGEDFINVTGEKEGKKKDNKKFAIDKKELKLFMKIFSDEKARDSRSGRDIARRISFSNLAKDSYPKVVKAFEKCNKEFFDDMWDDTPTHNGDKKKDGDKKNDQKKDNKDRRNDKKNDR